ncbi:hypothetical protein DRO26_03675 [Candidatus Bathyarchaeota archaeon]|nr:MAG: hypothetical protein DRO26_03675 [Candidatus Bathyarchaeota archaeon]
MVIDFPLVWKKNRVLIDYRFNPPARYVIVDRQLLDVEYHSLLRSMDRLEEFGRIDDQNWNELMVQLRNSGGKYLLKYGKVFRVFEPQKSPLIV